MSNLQKSAAAFKSSLNSAASQLPTRPKIVAPAPPPVASPPSTKRKRPLQVTKPIAAPIVYSQPTDTALINHDAYTQVHAAREYLKRIESRIHIDELIRYLSIPKSREFIIYLKTNPRINFHDDDDTVEYRPIHNVRSQEALLAYLQNQTTAMGLSVKELKDGWAKALEAIDELEARGEILVTRTKKDNQPRMVWGNDKTLDVDVDQEFIDIWQGIKIPPAEELPGLLEEQGLKPASLDPAKMKKEVKKEVKKKRANNRRGKTTNTHMQSILMDSKALRAGQH